MASGSQQNTNNDFVDHTQQPQVQQQHHIDGGTSHSSNSNVGVSPEYTTDNHLAGLVQAATAAAGQDVGWAQNDDSDMMAAGHGRAIQSHLDSYGVGMHLDDNGFATTSQTGHPFGGIPTSGDSAVGVDRSMSASNSTGSATTRKRKRNQSNVDPAMTSATARFRFGDGDESLHTQEVTVTQAPSENDGSSLDIREMPPQRVISDARAAGVHSAVALFRQPSATSKKATRPPMSKMFASLELSPENFLHLQAAAKAYMLDENHPERRDCVGQRGRGDTEMVKLRLWNCVGDFLEREGNGLRFFGENAVNEGVGPREMIWPRDDQKIISLVIPLLRRMVTNERQRQYAIETRKGGNTEDKEKRNSATVSDTIPESVQRYHQPPPNNNTELGMLGLIRTEYPTYPTDWDSVARSYDTYNQGYRLDNLGSISGLSQQDWWGLVATVDCHYQLDHGGDATLCTDSCQECTVNHIMSSESMSEINFRISGEEDIAARNYFASGITRDVTRIVKSHLLEHPNIQQNNGDAHQHHPQFPTSAPMIQQPDHQQPDHQVQIQQELEQQPQHHQVPDSLPVTVSINIIQDQEHKRIYPRFQVTANQCADLPTLLNTIRQYYHGQTNNQAPQTMRVRAWLDDGLQPILNDTQWLAALVMASEIEWMDDELKVIVDKFEGISV
ncbi:uncharacterized protein GIQ15_04827 [Arthroderma uncinatum]|uniref:uncharacterized protein n=1 Tax=Arthroderma uncinatum TaxID=74035 RepID=UPI00144A7C51|nr:uncharacterized protein GIQ15_04827 [Arthroderma uncinatum]KAF3482068.1 hypothetical protein GIQ15_04827 [Arthroderma uncinatum]